MKRGSTASLGFLRPQDQQYPVPESGTLTAPQNVVVVQGTGAFQLTWNTVPGAVRYNVYIDGLLIANTLFNATSGPFGVAPGIVSRLEIEAVDAAGNLSPKSVPVPMTWDPAAVQATGEIKYAVVMLKFPDVPNEPFDAAYATAMMVADAPAVSVKSYMENASYGIATVSCVVVGWYDMPHNISYYLPTFDPTTGLWFGIYTHLTELLTDAMAVAAQHLTVTDYKQIVFPISGMKEAGISSGRPVLVSANTSEGFVLQTLLHELGHGFGGQHAGLLNVPGLVIGAQVVPPNLLDLSQGGFLRQSYSDYHDPLGLSHFPYGHYSSLHKELFGWLSPARVRTVTYNANYAIDRLEFPSNGIQQLRIPLMKDVSETYFYFLEYREEGVVIRLHTLQTEIQCDQWLLRNTNSILLSYQPGHIYDDTYRGVVINVLSMDGNRAVVNVTIPGGEGGGQGGGHKK